MKIDNVEPQRPPQRINFRDWEGFHEAYYRWEREGRNTIGNLQFHPTASGISCAFASVRGTWSNNHDQVWRQYCYMLKEAANFGKDVYVPVTDKEPLALQILQACPFVKYVSQGKSRHGNYQAYIFILNVKKKDIEVVS